MQRRNGVVSDASRPRRRTSAPGLGRGPVPQRFIQPHLPLPAAAPPAISWEQLREDMRLIFGVNNLHAPAAAAAASSSSVPADSASHGVSYPLHIFLEPVAVQDLLCDMPGCGDVVVRPLSMNCEHKYCGPCIAGWYAKTCPSCREPYDDLGGRLNRQMIGAIYKKRVRCLHHALGCTAEMEIGYENRNILAHREVCTFEPITCERCHAQVPRLKVEQHDAEECPGRRVSCVHCDGRVSMRDLKQHQTSVQDPISGDWAPCVDTMLCATRCRDGNGLIRVFKPADLPSHESDCKRRVRPCAVCPPFDRHMMSYDALLAHYRTKITSLDQALRVLLMQTFAEPIDAAAASPNRRATGENVRDFVPSNDPFRLQLSESDPESGVIIDDDGGEREWMPAAAATAAPAAPLPDRPRHDFVRSLSVGTPVEVFSNSLGTWKRAHVTYVDPEVVRVIAEDGKRHVKPKMSAHLRQCVGSPFRRMVRPARAAEAALVVDSGSESDAAPSRRRSSLAKKRKRIILSEDEYAEDDPAAARDARSSAANVSSSASSAPPHSTTKVEVSEAHATTSDVTNYLTAPLPFGPVAATGASILRVSSLASLPPPIVYTPPPPPPAATAATADDGNSVSHALPLPLHEAAPAVGAVNASMDLGGDSDMPPLEKPH